MSRANGVLLLYHRPAFYPDAATITDHINAFERYSRFPFWKLNTDYGFPRGLAELEFEAIVLHYTIFATGPYAYRLDEGFRAYLGDSDRSYKLAFFQDEHQYCRKRFAFLDDYRFDCVYTCLEPEHFDASYRRYTKVPKLVSHVPAYVHPDMVAATQRLLVPDSDREVDLGYRARPTPPYFGRGGMEKVKIAEDFLERVAGSDLTLDISIREEDRLYGEDWYRLIANCRGFLGTESGASCVDLEDEVREEYERLSADGHEVTVEELEQGALGRWDWKVPLRTTSSRHFEAAALRACQVMYEGRYSGALRPMEHYIPLRKDLSNFDEVIERLRDDSVRRELTDNAHRDLIESGEYTYERFIAGFDAVLEEAGLRVEAPSTDLEPVREQMERGRSPIQLASRYLRGVADRIYRDHPLLRKLILPPVWVLHRVVVVPLRRLARGSRRGAARP